MLLKQFPLLSFVLASCCTAPEVVPAAAHEFIGGYPSDSWASYGLGHLATPQPSAWDPQRFAEHATGHWRHSGPRRRREVQEVAPPPTPAWERGTTDATSLGAQNETQLQISGVKSGWTGASFSPKISDKQLLELEQEAVREAIAFPRVDRFGRIRTSADRKASGAGRKDVVRPNGAGTKPKRAADRADDGYCQNNEGDVVKLANRRAVVAEAGKWLTATVGQPVGLLIWFILASCYHVTALALAGVQGVLRLAMQPKIIFGSLMWGAMVYDRHTNSLSRLAAAVRRQGCRWGAVMRDRIRPTREAPDSMRGTTWSPPPTCAAANCTSTAESTVYPAI